LPLFTPERRGHARRAVPFAPERSTPQGTIVNSSSQSIWITADNRRSCLRSGERSDAIGDADGLFAERRGVLFDSVRSDLGGGRTNYDGAIKVCDAGTLTVHDAPTRDPAFIAEISAPGFVCRPGDPAGFKSPQWCASHPGWEFNTALLGRACPS